MGGAVSDNIELFDDFAARILARLYEHFPQPTGLIFTMFGCEDAEPELSGALPYEADVCVETMYRLMDFGFIAGNREQFGVSQAVLTLKGLEILNAVPSAIAEEGRLGDRLSHAVNQGAEETYRSVIRTVMTKGVELLTAP